MDYEHTLEHYQNLYNVSRRTIQRWKKKGYPLDDEAATRELIGRAGEQEAGEATPWIAGDGPLGLRASIERLQRAERDAHASWQAALAEDDETTASKRQRQWLELADQLRRIEKDTPQVTEANRKAVSLPELQTVLGELFQKLRGDLEGLPKRLALLVCSTDEIGAREILTKEINSIILNLFECRYLKESE